MVATNFVPSLRLCKESEGLWSNHPQDRGGPTMKGITIATFTAFWKREGRRGVPTLTDLRAISDADVQKIYKTGYWDACKCDDLPAGVDYMVFDYAVNSGPATAVKKLQELVGVGIDAVVGNATKKAVEDAARLNEEKLINDYMDARLRFMKSLKTWPTFKNGWTTRIKEVRAASLKFARNDLTFGRMSATVGSARAEDKAPSKTPLGNRLKVAASGVGVETINTAASKLTDMGSVSTLFSVLAAVLVVVGLGLTFYKLMQETERRDYEPV